MNASYTARQTDFRFQLKKVLGFERLCRLSSFSHADSALADAVLTQAARFATHVLAPLNVVGDVQGSRLENGRVQTRRQASATPIGAMSTAAGRVSGR